MTDDVWKEPVKDMILVSVSVSVFCELGRSRGVSSSALYSRNRTPRWSEAVFVSSQYSTLQQISVSNKISF